MAAGLSDAWGLYLGAIRFHAHQLLAWAHADARPALHDDLDEPSLTGLLGEKMKVRLAAPETPQAYDYYAIGDQEPVSPSGQMGNDRLRLDLCIIRTGVKPRLRYIVEAKRLRTGGFPIGRYVGRSGIGDFLECRYGAGCPEAAMIGLVQNKDAVYWQRELHRSFDAESAAGHLAVLEGLAPVHILESLPNELQSVHRRTDTTPIRLFHIFLDCTAPAATMLE
ncbi:MAG TPA: hypothetical protein VEW48_07335 [Thermoanaerobaculia bacterium]|nr:hypothetical protein [Thermoanaerobaculia bacterium]